MTSLGIVIPLYNEEACLPELIEELDTTLPELEAKVTVYAVNDGSKDQTGKLLEQYAQTRSWLKVYNRQNGGHGRAIRFGYDEAIKANEDWIFQCDSDRQIPLRELINIWNMRKAHEAVLAVRQNRQDPSERLLVSATLRFFIRSFFDVTIRDANCPFRLFPAHELKTFLTFIPEATFAPNVFISIMVKNGINVQEVFVEHLPRRTGENSINRLNLLKVCIRCTKELFNFWRSKKSWPKLQNIPQSSL